MEKLPDAIEGDLETSIINDPAFRKFILKKVKRGNRNIHRLVEELKRDPEFREAIRTRSEKIEQHDVALKHMPNDIKGYAQIGVVSLGILILMGVLYGLDAIENNYGIYLGFFSITTIYLAVLFVLAYIFTKL